MAEHACRCHPVPVPPDRHGPLPVWVVTIGCDRDGDEVAAVFAAGLDARRYAAWWNREEMRRYGHLATHAIATAVAEEVDFYPAGSWRPPAHLRVTEAGVASSDTGSSTRRVPAIGGPTDDHVTSVAAQAGDHPSGRGSRDGTA